MPTLPTAPNTLACLQAMQGIIVNECLVGGVSPFAALAAGDAARFGVGRAVLVGKPKDFKDGYLPQCNLWIPPGEDADQEQELVGYGSGAGVGGRVFGEFVAVVTAYVDLRTDWYAGEQQILEIRDALWPALLRHAQLGGTVAGVIEAEAFEGQGLGYELVAGMEYRTYEARWWVRAQWSLSGGRII